MAVRIVAASGEGSGAGGGSVATASFKLLARLSGTTVLDSGMEGNSWLLLGYKKTRDKAGSVIRRLFAFGAAFGLLGSFWPRFSVYA